MIASIRLDLDSIGLSHREARDSCDELTSEVAQLPGYASVSRKDATWSEAGNSNPLVNIGRVGVPPAHKEAPTWQREEGCV